MADTEIWKDIEGYEGLYQVSNLGRVRSLPRTLKGKGHNSKGGLLKPDITNNKQRVTLSNKRFMVHILVAKAFPEICGNWFEGCEVHHKDQNSSNNYADNLICLSHKEHRDLHIQLGSWAGENNSQYGKKPTQEMIQKRTKKRKKPIYQCTLEGEEICYWFSVTDCHKETGYHKSAINRCCLGKQKNSYGFKWKYAS